MKNGLKKILNDKVKKDGYVSINEIHQLAKDHNHKESYAERELRPSHSPNVEPVRNEKGHNIGYRWIGEINGKIKGIDSNVVIETRSIYSSKNNDKKEDFKPSKKDLLEYS